MFTDAERAYIGSGSQPGEARLAHIATSSLNNQPHVVPLRAWFDEAGEKIIVLGTEMARSFKYRQVKKNPKVAIVWDSSGGALPTSKGIEVRGEAAIKQDSDESDPYFEVTATKVFSWGINEPAADSFETKMGMDTSHLR